MQLKKRGGALAALALAVASLPSHAQLLVSNQPGVYGQLAFGRAHLSADCSGQAACGSSGVSARLGAGLRVGGGWAIEFGRQGLANFDYKRRADDSHRDIEVEAWQVGVAQHIELTPQWLLVPRLGLGRVSSQTDAGYWPSSDSERRREWRPYGGMSLVWRLNRVLSLQLQADYQRVPLRHDNGRSEDADAATLALGLGFNY
ncbi:outer membrane beta-barrel protein [Inhella sp.]|uniref:outer membrane beta-barrel protein n=1 Tax=Inhella sp. TaxID=1921806 RepID=UPI0035AEA7E6